MSPPQMVTDQNGDGPPSFNDTVTFVVHTVATVPVGHPEVLSERHLGLQDSNAMFGRSLDQDFTLGPTLLWT